MTLSIAQTSKQNTNEVLQSSTGSNGRLNRQAYSNVHTVSHNDKNHSVDTYSDNSITNESVTVAYTTQSDFDSHMIDSLIATGNIFAALKLANEINELNDCNVISDYHIRYVKDYFIKEGSGRGKSDTNDYPQSKVELRKSYFSRNESVNSKKHYSQSRIGESQKGESKARQLQKGYMKMMSR